MSPMHAAKIAEALLNLPLYGWAADLYIASSEVNQHNLTSNAAKLKPIFQVFLKILAFVYFSK